MSRGGGRAVERRILRHLHGRNSRTHLRQIHAHILRHHLHNSNQILSHFISVCGSLHKMDYAHLVFHQTHHPNILLYNSMIKGHSLSPPFETSLHFFRTMKKHGIWPDEFTFAPLIKSCSNLGDAKSGQTVHGEVISLGFEHFSAISIGIVELYASCGRMKDAKKVFDVMLHRDVIIWNLMIRGFCKTGNVDMGYSLFREMRERSVVSWNSIISSLAKSGRETESLKLFNEMRENGFEVDEATVATMLPVCAILGKDDVGQWIHSYAKSSGLYLNYISVGNSLVDFYCKRGCLDTAFMVFEDMPRRTVVSWNAMISGLAFNGNGEKGLALFEEMIKNGFNPNESTFVAVLTCCVHIGSTQKGRDLFASMFPNYNIPPKLEHYGCMVDLLGRDGCIKEAHNLIQSMPMKPNAAIWGALLSSCRTHDYLELAELAIKELIVLEPGNSGNYVLLSNVFAQRGKWDEVDKVRVLMREGNIEKAPGQSVVG